MSYLCGGPSKTVPRYTTEGAATAAQSSIPIPGGFVPGMVDVFVGGAALSKGDYDDTSGTSIALTKSMAAGTQYKVVSYLASNFISTNAMRVAVEGAATSGQTTIPIPGGYMSGMIDVYVGGILLLRADYNDSDGQTIVLAKAMSAGTAYRILGWSPKLAAQPVGGQLAGFRNKIINGNFDIWQRGTTGSPIDNNGNVPTGGNAYGFKADRWFSQVYGGGGATGNAVIASPFQAFVLGQTDVPGEPKYFHRLQATSLPTHGAGAIIRAQQSVESVRSFAGQQATLSFWARAESARAAAVCLVQKFGSGGSPSANINAGQFAINVSPTWQKFVLTCSVPSVAGKTLGTNNDDCLIAVFCSYKLDGLNTGGDTLGQVGSWSTAAYLDIASVQLEPGPVATPFEDRPIGTELALCQRYFWSSYPPGVAPGTANQNATALQGRQTTVGSDTYPTVMNGLFPVPLRAGPTVNIYSPQTGASGKIYVSSGVDAPAGGAFSQTSFLIQVANYSVSGGYGLLAHATASAEL